MENVEELLTIETIIKIVIFIILAIVIIAAIHCIVKSMRKTIRGVRSTISDISNIASLVRDSVDAANEVPDIKDVGGATDMFLRNVIKDFPDFHNAAAEADIRTFMEEYVNIIYGTATDFKKSKVSSKIDIAKNKVGSGAVNNIRVNKIAIYDYKKTKEYATIRYRVSIGFSVDDKRIETRYEVDYTYQMYEDDIATGQILCKVCGAPIEDLKSGKCPYCGAAFIKDTILSWDITGVKNF